MKLPRFKLPTAGGLVLAFALLCVAVTSGVVIYMRVWETDLLSDPLWCQRIIAAAKTSEQVESAFGGCFSVMKQQLSAIAVNSHVDAGVLALCLLVLMVIVVAGGKLSFAISKDSASANIGADAQPAVVTTTTTAVTSPPPPPAPEAPPVLEDAP